MKENITPEQQDFEKHDQRKITRQLESLGVGTTRGLQAWILRDDLDSKTEKGRDNTGRYTEGAQTAKRIAGIFWKKIIWPTGTESKLEYSGNMLTLELAGKGQIDTIPFSA